MELTNKKIIGLILLIAIVSVIACIVVVSIAWNFGQRPWIELATKLNIPSNSSVSEINNHVDCELVHFGMSPDEVREALSVLNATGSYELQPNSRSQLFLGFPDSPLDRRHYYFTRESLETIYRVRDLDSFGADQEWTEAECNPRN